MSPVVISRVIRGFNLGFVVVEGTPEARSDQVLGRRFGASLIFACGTNSMVSYHVVCRRKSQFTLYACLNEFVLLTENPECCSSHTTLPGLPDVGVPIYAASLLRLFERATCRGACTTGETLIVPEGAVL